MSVSIENDISMGRESCAFGRKGHPAMMTESCRRAPMALRRNPQPFLRADTLIRLETGR
jgi:hypothetical protein